MANISITISLPAEKAQEVADAVAAASYGTPATAAGVKAYLIKHLREAVSAKLKGATPPDDFSAYGDLRD